jgi:hypothetical protein
MLRLLLIVASLFSPGGNTSACVTYWQRELGLRDWTITTKIVSDEELGGRILGDIEINEPSKTAVVHLMRVEDSDLSPQLARAEQRFTIAHELMHLRLYINKDPDWRNERMVDTTVISLMRNKGRWTELLAIEHE